MLRSWERLCSRIKIGRKSWNGLEVLGKKAGKRGLSAKSALVGAPGKEGTRAGTGTKGIPGEGFPGHPDFPLDVFVQGKGILRSIRKMGFYPHNPTLSFYSVGAQGKLPAVRVVTFPGKLPGSRGFRSPSPTPVQAWTPTQALINLIINELGISLLSSSPFPCCCPGVPPWNDQTGNAGGFGM